jgi:hypothetical protein
MGRIKTRYVLLFIFLCAAAWQRLFSAPSGIDASTTNGVYQTPPVLYVGDKGSLVYPLDIFSTLPDGDLVFPDGLPRADDIVIHRVDLDKRGRRVIVEFQAFRTGIVPLPPIQLPGGSELKGLQVNIASILDSEKGSMTLSPSAGLMSAPGTFWIITAFSLLFVIVLTAIVLLWVKGGAAFAGIRNALRTHILLHCINVRLRRLEKQLELGQFTERQALSMLSSEIRAFLSRFWMRSCYAVSAEEFLYFDLPRQGAPAMKAGVAESGDTKGEQLLSTLSSFFGRCDEIRFAAAMITRETVRAVCAEAKSLVNGRELVESSPWFTTGRKAPAGLTYGV